MQDSVGILLHGITDVFLTAAALTVPLMCFLIMALKKNTNYFPMFVLGLLAISNIAVHFIGVNNTEHIKELAIIVTSTILVLSNNHA